jgi:hypothetical protein
LAGALCAALLGPLLVTVVGTGAPTAQAAGPIFGTPEPQDVFPPGPGTDARLVTRPNDVQTFYAYTAPGEELQALFDKFGNTNRVIDIVVTSPSGAVFTQPVPTVGNGQWGFERGDLPSEEGIWQIELVPAGRLSSDSTQMRSYNAVFAADGSEKPGRVWTERLALFQPGAPRDLQLYFMSSLGYVYDTQYFDYVGINSTISADSVGNVELNPDGSLNCSTSAYQSFVLPTNTLDAAEIGNGSVAMAAGRCGGSYRVFFSEPFADDPAGAIPEATENPGESPTDWVRPEIEPPFFELTDYVGTSTTSVEGLLRADVDNFFGSVEIEVLDEVGNLLRTFTLNVPEGEGLRQVDLPFDGLDDNGDPIPPDDVTTFRVRGLNAGEIHFVLNDVEHLNGGMRVEALNGPIAGTSEATRIFWGEADNYDGQPGRGCNIPAPTVDTATEGVLSDPCVRRWQSGHIGGRGYGERRAVDQWARQGVAVTSTLTLRDPDADYTIVKSVEPSSGGVRPGETVTYTLTLQNVSDVDLWDVRDVVDDLSDVVDDADYNFDATLTGSWSGDVPSPGGAPVFDAAEETLTFRVNVPAGETVTITYSVTVREDAQRGDDVLDNIVAPPPEFPPEDPDPADCPPSDPRFPCLTTTTPVIDVQSWKQLMADPTPVQAGTVLTYTLFFENVGGAAGDVNEIDDLTQVIDDADVTSEPASDDLVASRVGDVISITGSLDPGEQATVTYQMTVRPDGERGDDLAANYLLAPGEEPPDDPVCQPSDIERPDCTLTPIGQLATFKSVSASTDPVVAGTELTYTLTFDNQGQGPSSIDMVDDLSYLLDDATLTAGPAASDGALTVSEVVDGRFTVTGELAAGQTVTVSYTVRVNPEDERGNDSAANFLLDPSQEPPEGCVQPDASCTETPLPNVSVVKSVEESADPSGTVLTYTLTFANTGTAAGPVFKVDDLSGVLDDAYLSSEPVASSDALSASGVTDGRFTVAGDLEPGQTVTVTYQVTVRPAGERGDNVAVNFLLDGLDEPPPEDCPAGSDDCTQTPLPEVTDSKSVDPPSGTPVVSGQELTYTLTFANAGETTGTVDRVDDLTHVLDDADVVSEPVASDPALTARRDGAQITIAGQLAPDQTVTVSFTVRVRPDGDRGDNILANFLLDPDEPPPPDPVCEPADGEFTLLSDEDCTENPVGELAVTKSVDPASGTRVAPGDELDYTLTFTNTGTARAAVDYTDHLAGLADDATLLDGPTPSDPALTVSDVQNDEYTITGTLAAGQTVTVTYTVEVKPRDELGDSLLENHLSPTGEDPPGECRDTDPLCTLNPVTPPDLPDTGTGLATQLLIGATAALLGGLVLLGANRRLL